MEDGFIDLAMYLSINKYFICFANAPHCTFAQSIKDLNNDTYLRILLGLLQKRFKNWLQR
jgi:hypothetical protein